MENQPPATAPQGQPNISSTKIMSRLTHFITAAYFGGFLLKFFSLEKFNPDSGMGLIYASLLVYYAGEKEVRRWNGLIPEDTLSATEGSQLNYGKGEYIVTAWCLLFSFCWLFSTLKPDYKIPNDLPNTCIRVLTIFLGSKASKRLYLGRLKKTRNPFPRENLDNGYFTLTDQAVEETYLLNNASRIDPILDYLKKNGKITRENVAEILGVSERTASRILQMLANKGRIKWVGKWEKDPEGYYVLPEK